ncbi:MAG: ROK family protein [Oscillospiraceae bacterium]|nr:ROK family protein [Candidatus Equicaccousia limihippi]
MLAGIDIGGTKCAVILGTEEGEIVKKVKFATVSREDAMQKIFAALDELGDFDDIAIPCGGPLDSKNGVIINPPNLPGWENYPIVKIMKDRYKVPCYLCNDANAGALAEWQFGAGKGCNNMAFLTFGTGLGAGLILDGKLYSGTNDMAGEIGHIRLAKDGPEGFYKHGSFEGFCSGGGMKKLGVALMREELKKGNTMPYCRCEADLEDMNAKIISEYARKGDPLCLKVFEITGTKLGEGLAILVDMLNLERIVIGSLFAREEKLFRPIMEKSLAREAIPLSLSVAEVVPAALGEQIGDIAAITLAKLAKEQNL